MRSGSWVKVDAVCSPFLLVFEVDAVCSPVLSLQVRSKVATLDAVCVRELQSRGGRKQKMCRFGREEKYREVRVCVKERERTTTRRREAFIHVRQYCPDTQLGVRDPNRRQKKEV